MKRFLKRLVGPITWLAWLALAFELAILAETGHWVDVDTEETL